MHPHPFPTPRTRTIRAMALAFPLCAISCAVPQLSQLPPIITSPSPIILPVVHSQIRTVYEESVVYSVHSSTSSEEQHPTQLPVRESITLAEPVRATISRLLPGSYRLSLSSDSSTPPNIANIRHDSVTNIGVVLDSTTQNIHFGDYSSAPVCNRTPTSISPLLLYALLSELLTNSSLTSPTDTLHQTYSACRNHVTSTTNIALTAIVAQRDDGTVISGLNFSGLFNADSSAFLPMRLTGILSGTTMVVPDTGTTILPHSLTMVLYSRIKAQSSIKQQTFEQHTEIRLLKLSR